MSDGEQYPQDEPQILDPRMFDRGSVPFIWQNYGLMADCRFLEQGGLAYDISLLALLGGGKTPSKKERKLLEHYEKIIATKLTKDKEKVEKAKELLEQAKTKANELKRKYKHWLTSEKIVEDSVSTKNKENKRYRDRKFLMARIWKDDGMTPEREDMGLLEWKEELLRTTEHILAKRRFDTFVTGLIEHYNNAGEFPQYEESWKMKNGNEDYLELCGEILERLEQERLERELEESQRQKEVENKGG